MIQKKRGSLSESVAETINHEAITLDAKLRPWFLVEAELDPAMPDRPSSGALAQVKVLVTTSKTQPTGISLNQSEAVTTKCNYRSVADNLHSDGPDIWRGTEALVREGDYYYANVSVHSANQATPATKSCTYYLKFATADELIE